MHQGECYTITKLTLNGSVHNLMAVAKNQRSNGHCIIEIAVPINIPQMRAFCTGSVDWCNTLYVLSGTFCQCLCECRDQAFCASKHVLRCNDRWVMLITHRIAPDCRLLPACYVRSLSDLQRDRLIDLHVRVLQEEVLDGTTL